MKRKMPNGAEVWRVRGYKGDEIRHTRVYQRRAAALDNYRAALRFYDRVTLERAPLGEYVRVKADERWWM
jgi:hypothetical protein